MFVGCSEISTNVIVKYKQHVGIIWPFCLPGRTCSFFQCLGGEKKMLVCGLLGGGLAPRLALCLIRSMKFISPEVALYFYKSTIHPCMEYCCHVWAGAPSWYLELLDKLQKQICRTVGPSVATFFEPLAHC